MRSQFFGAYRENAAVLAIPKEAKFWADSKFYAPKIERGVLQCHTYLLDSRCATLIEDPMLLTITNTSPPATDLGYLLVKNPSRPQSFDASFGKIHIFYPEASAERCTAAVLLDVDPVALVRGRRGSNEGALLDQYVNDRPYVASSFLSVAIAQALGSALGGRSKDRPELVDTPLALEAKLSVLPCRGGEALLRRLFERLGYEYTPDTASKNIAYYEPRTTHGSTLSFIVHAAILADLHPERAWEMFVTALESDVGDIQGGTTQEGIHMGVMAGTLDLIQRGYVGAKIWDGTLYFNPKPNDRLDGLSLPMRFRETSVEVTLKEGKLAVATQTDGFNRSIKVGVGDEVREIKDEERYSFNL